MCIVIHRENTVKTTQGDILKSTRNKSRWILKMYEYPTETRKKKTGKKGKQMLADIICTNLSIIAISVRG